LERPFVWIPVEGVSHSCWLLETEKEEKEKAPRKVFFLTT